MNIIIFSSLFFVFSCARINQDSRDQKTRHGVMPIGSAEINTNEKPKNIQQHFEQSSILRGKAIYKKQCLSCHGDQGLGDGPDAGKQSHPPANLQKLARDVPNFKFFMSISQWDGKMPGWKEQFNESDREDLVSYIKTFR